MSDYDFEPVRGLPQRLPPAEALLWQGSPRWRSLAVRAFHVRKVALYFGLLAIWCVASASADGKGFWDALLSAAWVPLGLVAAVAPLTLLAWLTERTTVYTVTSRRLVMRVGIALPITINIPFRMIDAVALKRHGDGSGDIPASIAKECRVAFLVLWPHARPWLVRNPQPMLRAIPDAERVARIIVEAISASTAQVAHQAPDQARDRAARPVEPVAVPVAA
ncbi:MAG TPA: photosynthetic complex putative assembly protein PuhB [Vineibacter sp.]|nr:photosynthetic complex putative assembly protein PuhB [Vineibacter sp.]